MRSKPKERESECALKKNVAVCSPDICAPGIAARVARRKKGTLALESVSPEANAANPGTASTRIGRPNNLAGRQIGSNPGRSDQPPGERNSPLAWSRRRLQAAWQLSSENLAVPLRRSPCEPFGIPSLLPASPSGYHPPNSSPLRRQVAFCLRSTFRSSEAFGSLISFFCFLIRSRKFPVWRPSEFDLQALDFSRFMKSCPSRFGPKVPQISSIRGLSGNLRARERFASDCVIRRVV